MSEPLLRIRNHHAATCGDPPIVNGDDERVYIGYFENPYGEQWIFTFDKTTHRAELRGGDVGWNRINIVEAGQVHGLILGAKEAAWL
jgi:hypothetical protein